MTYKNRHDSKEPIEVRLLEDIADELEIWANERKTDFRAKIYDALPEFQKYTTVGDFLIELSNKPEPPELFPLFNYFSIPNRSEELTSITEWFQSDELYHLSNMLIRYQNDIYSLHNEILSKTGELGNYAHEPESNEFRLLTSYFAITFSQTIPALVKRLGLVVKMAKDKFKAEKQTETEQKTKAVKGPPELNDAEQYIIEALGTKTLIGEELAKKAGYPYNSNFKSTLARLRKRAILGNKAPGYFLEPEYHFLLNKSD